MKELAKMFSGFLTPVIAIVTMYIAFQQYRTNRLKLKFELYEKRLIIHQALIDFISYVISFPEMRTEEVKKLDVARAESVFLFGKDIPEYLASVRDKAARMASLNSQSKEFASSEQSNERTLLVNEKLKLIEWFHEQINDSTEKFQKHLSFAQL